MTSRGSYDLLQLVDKNHARLALDSEVVLVTIGADEPTFTLTHDAERAGAKDLAWQQGTYPHAAVHALLDTAIYHDHTLTDLAAPDLWGALAVFIGGVMGALAQDVILARASRAWRRTESGTWDLPRPEHVVTVTPERPVGLGGPPEIPSRTGLPGRPPVPSAALNAASALPSADGVTAPTPVPWYQRFFL
jgi:hypothetical protein